jgi:N-acetylmuramoyl-L-alanine amidase
LVAIAALLAVCVAPALASRAVVTTQGKSPVRSGPSTEYARMMVLPPGAKLWATGQEGSWYRIRLCDRLDGWISTSDVRQLDSTIQLASARLTDMSLSPCETGTRIIFYLTRPVAFRIRQSVLPPQLKIDLFNCAAAQEGIRQFPGTEAIRVLPPQQLANDWVEVTLDLPNVHQTGHQAYYTDSGHLVVIVKAPFADGQIAGKRIAIDPGHGGPDSGAVGPTGLTEKSANLEICKVLKWQLTAAGAKVLMTRETDKAVSPGASKGGELEARVAATKTANPDLFISVHNNAVGGGNAAQASGTETYYWTAMSYLPALMVQKGLVGALGTRDRFVGWQRFYVLRETDCPRILAECAFVSNPDEEKKLRDPVFLAQASQGMFEGIKSYFAAAVQPPTFTPAGPDIKLFPVPLVEPEG